MDEKHVCSLELSKELKANGYKQEGEFWWCNYFDCEYRLGKSMPCLYENNKFRISFGKPFVEEWYEDKRFDCFVAPLASELLEELPEKIGNKIVCVHKIMGRYEVFAYDQYGASYEIESDNVCDALAELWLYCKKNNLL